MVLLKECTLWDDRYDISFDSLVGKRESIEEVHLWNIVLLNWSRSG